MLETIWEGIGPYLWQILGIILTTVVSYVGLRIKKIYEAKLKAETKRNIVKHVVDMIEQTSKKNNWTGREKYEKAKETSIQLLNEAGIKITDLELDVLIESLCNMCNIKPR